MLKSCLSDGDLPVGISWQFPKNKQISVRRVTEKPDDRKPKVKPSISDNELLGLSARRRRTEFFPNQILVQDEQFAKRKFGLQVLSI